MSAICSGRASIAARPTKRVVQRDRDVPQLLEHLVAGAVGRPHEEALLGLVELHQRAAVGAGQLHCVHDDRREHRVEVEAGAHRLPDLAQRLQLIDLAGELGAASLEGAHEVQVADGDGRRRGERGEER